MDVTTIQTFITSLGFPICCVVALAFFIWNIWNHSEKRNEDREDKLYDVIIKAQAQNEVLSQTNTEFIEVLRTYKEDIQEIKTDVIDIKNKIGE